MSEEVRIWAQGMEGGVGRPDAAGGELAERSEPERSDGERSGGALGMAERMEVEVLCGACRRQPQAEGNCARRFGPMHQIVFPARACGMEAGCVSQHRT